MDHEDVTETAEVGGNEDEAQVDQARRLLLKTAVYAAPIVLSLVEVKTASAQASGTPCNPPVGCQPELCMPRN